MEFNTAKEKLALEIPKFYPSPMLSYSWINIPDAKKERNGWGSYINVTEAKEIHKLVFELKNNYKKLFWFNSANSTCLSRVWIGFAIEILP